MTHRFTHKLMTRVKNWPGAYYTNWKLPYHTEKDPTKAHKTRKPNPRRSKMFIDKTKRNISKKLPYHTEKDPTKAHKTRKPNPRRSKMFIDKTKRNISKKRNSLQKN